MSMPPTAMVLAAGLGKRLRPLTDRIPKPLVAVAGRTLLDRALDHLEAAGVARVVVNTHYKGAMIAEHLAGRTHPRIDISAEDELLETGGGVAKALPLLSERFFVVNSDVLWLDGPVGALDRLAEAWDDARHDAVLLLQRTVTAVGYDGDGDYVLDALGHARRRARGAIAPYLYAGVQIVHRRLFAGAPAGAFSMNVLWDRAEAAGRLGGIVHDGAWYHVGTPEGLAATEARLALPRAERRAT